MKGGILPTRIGYFRGDYGWASNFSPAEVKLWATATGMVFSSDPQPGSFNPTESYQSVEHGYHAAKFLDPRIREKFQMLGLSPGQAKGLAENLRQKGKVRADWKDVQIEVMRGLLKQKFTYSILRRKLLSTFSAELVEGNTWHDNFWGDCVCDECADVPGLNHLGRLLMEIRKL
jgi:ribA/ribD-fused uncharacterized protein